MDFEVEQSQILYFTILLGQDLQLTDIQRQSGVGSQTLEGTRRLKLRQSQTMFYDLPKMSTFIQLVLVYILIILDRFIFLGNPQYTT